MGDLTEGKNIVSYTHRASSNLSFQIPIESLKPAAVALIPLEQTSLRQVAFRELSHKWDYPCERQILHKIGGRFRLGDNCE